MSGHRIIRSRLQRAVVWWVALRRFYHLARYRWLEDVLARDAQGPLRMFELGCFDGKTTDFLPDRLQRYVGVDANWEGGLDIGREALKGRSEISFIKSEDPAALDQFADDEFNVTVALETLEHIHPPVMHAYLEQMARITKGLVLVSVPNELGPVFLAKHRAKVLKIGEAEPYSARDIVAATCRQSAKIKRVQEDGGVGHKGFDYRVLIEEIRSYFDILFVTGVPFMGLPPALSLTVGIVARTRN